jgi:hypothetical protein
MYLFDEEQLHTHVILVAWLNILSNGFLLLMACFVFFLLSGIGVIARDPEAMKVLSVIGIGTGCFMFVLALPGIVAGVGLLMRKSWGRILAIVVGVFSLVNIPIGTLIGAYTLVVLLQDSATAYFANSGTEPTTEITTDSGNYR